MLGAVGLNSRFHPKSNIKKDNNIIFGAKIPMNPEIEAAFKVKLLKFFANSNTSMLSDICKASGKAIITPFVILFNPFSNQDKRSRKKTAWLQPLEALMGFTFGTCINLTAMKYIEKKALAGKFGDIYINAGKSIETAGPKEALNIINAQKALRILKGRASTTAQIMTIPILSLLLISIFAKINSKFSNNDSILKSN